jgi:hypothetical protein
MRDDFRVTDLMAHASKGDQQAWTALVELYSPRIWSICRRYRLRRRRRGCVSGRLAAPGGPAGQPPRSGRAAGLDYHYHGAGMLAGPAR